MSDRLAISATFSVLMMSLYVLFGAEATNVSFAPIRLDTAPGIAAPVHILGQGQLVGILD